MYIKTITEINNKWTEYNKMVAKCQLMNFGKIFIDEYDEPIDNEYILEEITKV